MIKNLQNQENLDSYNNNNNEIHIYITILNVNKILKHFYKFSAHNVDYILFENYKNVYKIKISIQQVKNKIISHL